VHMQARGFLRAWPGGQRRSRLVDSSIDCAGLSAEVAKRLAELTALFVACIEAVSKFLKVLSPATMYLISLSCQLL